MKIPDTSYSIQQLIDNHHQTLQDPPRPHLGVSGLGYPCDRWLWLSFHWAVVEQFDGRILRLFRRGHNEEATIISDLRAIGMDVRTSKNQHRVNFGSHVSGSIDAIIESGVPESPNKPHVAEFKTHALKSFSDLDKNGLQKSKPVHYVQLQVYMYGTDIDRGLYVAICKDNDLMYTERVKLDKALAEKYIARGQRIALDNRMPPPLSTNPTWYECKQCPAHSFCHETKMTKEVNCRTCAHSTALADSTWRCERHNADNIPVEFQREGCESHVFHPDLVPWELDANQTTEHMAVWIVDGKPLKNGDPAPGVFTSREIAADLIACSKNDKTTMMIRSEFDARVA
jgi:hypothetical protein